MSARSNITSFFTKQASSAALPPAPSPPAAKIAAKPKPATAAKPKPVAATKPKSPAVAARVALIDLLECGMLTVGAELSFTYMQTSFAGVIGASGKIAWNGNVYASPKPFVLAAKRSLKPALKATDSWRILSATLPPPLGVVSLQELKLRCRARKSKSKLKALPTGAAKKKESAAPKKKSKTTKAKAASASASAAAAPAAAPQVAAAPAPSTEVTGATGTTGATGAVTGATGKRKRAPNVTLTGMLKHGMLWDGAMLRYTYATQRFDGIINARGAVEWDGRAFTSPNAFALAAKRTVKPDLKSAGDGWSSVRVLRGGTTDGEEPHFEAMLSALKAACIVAIETAAVTNAASAAVAAAAAAAAAWKEADLEANPPKPPPPRAPAVKLLDLIVSNFLDVGSTLIFVHDAKSFEGVLTATGTISWDGREFNSPNAFALAAKRTLLPEVKKLKADGWNTIHVRISTRAATAAAPASSSPSASSTSVDTAHASASAAAAAEADAAEAVSTIALSGIKAEFIVRWRAQQIIENEGSGITTLTPPEQSSSVSSSSISSPPQPSRVIALKSWEGKMLQRADAKAPDWHPHVLELLRDGYTVVRDALPIEMANELINGPPITATKTATSASATAASSSSSAPPPPPARRVMRQRSGAQVWLGARRSIRAHIRGVSDSASGEMQSDGVISVVAPLCTRGVGRFDFPLPANVSSPVEETLRTRGLRPLQLVQHMLRGKGKIQTQNIMLSESGAERQPKHTDSWWGETRPAKAPAPHYYTILVALVPQDEKTGGTRLYTGTHRNKELNPPFNAGVEIPMNAGDAVIFDGLLQHQGTENVTSSPPISRYFYYIAVCLGEDPNTEVTGKGYSAAAKKNAKRRKKAPQTTKEVAKLLSPSAAAPDQPQPQPEPQPEPTMAQPMVVE